MGRKCGVLFFTLPKMISKLHAKRSQIIPAAGKVYTDGITMDSGTRRVRVGGAGGGGSGYRECHLSLKRLYFSKTCYQVF